MNRNQKEQYLQTRWQIEYERRDVAQSIQDLFPKCKEVKLEIKLSFVSAFGKNEKEINATLNPCDKLYWHHDCLNKDCTGFGFSLTNEIRTAIQTRQTIEGKLNCDGKEDWKYINNMGCSCNSSCHYKIIPLF